MTWNACKLARQIKLFTESIRSRMIVSKKNCTEGKQITPLAIVVLLEERSHYVLLTLYILSHYDQQKK